MSALSAIHARCEALMQAYRFKGVSPEDELLPGLSEDELAQMTAWFPATLPDDVKAMYTWRNGHRDDAWHTQHVFGFRDTPFRNVTDLRSEYVSMMSTYGAVKYEFDKVDLEFCFPFAASNGGWLVVPCAGHDFGGGHEFPVISVFSRNRRLFSFDFEHA